MNMINLNGTIQETQNQSLDNNRGFLYGDALFDSLLVKENKLIFLEAHYFRLLAGMRQLRMEIPKYFTQEYWEIEIRRTLDANVLTNARVRTTVYRNTKGLYTPETNNTRFIIQVVNLKTTRQSDYFLGVYRENYVNTTPISSIKTTNRLPNVLASIFAKENGFDNCLLLNNKKQVAEAINSNIFLVFNNQIITPPLSEGCVAGIIRNKIIETVKKSGDLQIIERIVEIHDLLRADEVFLTNSIFEIQAVTLFKKKKYKIEISRLLHKRLKGIMNGI